MLYGDIHIFSFIPTYSIENKTSTLNGHSSEVKSILSAVLQGSILKALLFNIYINRIPSIDNTAKFNIYADKTSTLFSKKTADDIIDMANNASSRLYKWACSNLFKSNSLKTKAVLFRKRKIK